MRRLIFAALPLCLSACTPPLTQPPEQYALSGTVTGDWSANANLRLLWVGTGFPELLVQRANLAQNVVRGGAGWRFGVELPAFPALAGAYQVIAYDDSNHSGDYTLGEHFTRNRQWLIFSPTVATLPAQKWNETELLPQMKVAAGWNLYDAAQPAGAGNPRPVSSVRGYDLRR